MLPLAESYLGYLESVQKVDSNRQLLAGWSNRAWALEVGKVLSSLSDPECLARLRLTGPHLDMEQDEEDADLWFRLVVSTASHRCWSMAIHSELPPDQWFGVLDVDPSASNMAFSKLRTAFRVITQAKQRLETQGEHAPSQKAKEAGI